MIMFQHLHCYMHIPWRRCNFKLVNCNFKIRHTRTPTTWVENFMLGLNKLAQPHLIRLMLLTRLMWLGHKYVEFHFIWFERDVLMYTYMSVKNKQVFLSFGDYSSKTWKSSTHKGFCQRFSSDHLGCNPGINTMVKNQHVTVIQNTVGIMKFLSNAL